VKKLLFNKLVQVQAPVLGSDEFMLSLAMLEQSGTFRPTDLKRLDSGGTEKMRTTSDPTMFPYVISFVVKNPQIAAPASVTKIENPMAFAFGPDYYLGAYNKASTPTTPPPDFNRISLNIQPVSGTVTPQFLNLVDAPALSGQTLGVNPPTLVPGLEIAGTYIVLSEIEKITVGPVPNERRTRLWEVFSHAWLTQVNLPKIAVNYRADRSYRWEVIYLARPQGTISSSKLPTDRLDLKTLTHASRNALDI
jgi:hypothetical protein